MSNIFKKWVELIILSLFPPYLMSELSFLGSISLVLFFFLFHISRSAHSHYALVDSASHQVTYGAFSPSVSLSLFPSLKFCYQPVFSTFVIQLYLNPLTHYWHLCPQPGCNGKHIQILSIQNLKEQRNILGKKESKQKSQLIYFVTLIKSFFFSYKI